MVNFANKNHITTIEDCLDVYLKDKPANCILYSQDGGIVKIHKEILIQTNFLREILSSTKEHCCGKINISCPCTQKELEHLANFLYDGEIQYENDNDCIEIQENLHKIFGFSKDLMFNHSVSEKYPENTDIKNVIKVNPENSNVDSANEIDSYLSENSIEAMSIGTIQILRDQDFDLF